MRKEGRKEGMENGRELTMMQPQRRLHPSHQHVHRSRRPKPHHAPIPAQCALLRVPELHQHSTPPGPVPVHPASQSFTPPYMLSSAVCGL
jgi:hypothetical protein